MRVRVEVIMWKGSWTCGPVGVCVADDFGPSIGCM